MALQGTLETFALPDVLRLLDTTKNTGCLVLTADNLTGSIYLADGAIVGARSTRVPDHRSVLEVVFDLLRFTEGSFSFDENVEPAEAEEPVDVDETLVEAQAMLEEWREIEKVVPSLDHWVTLSVDLPSHEVVVTAARWRTIAAVGGGRSVRGIGDALDLGEVDVSRTVKELVEAGLAVMGENVGARPVSDRLSTLSEPSDRSSNGSESSPAMSEPVAETVAETVEAEPMASFDPGDLESTMSSNGDNVVQLDARAAEPSGDPLADAGFSADDAFLADVFPGLAGKNGGAEPAAEPEPEPAAFDTSMINDLPEVSDEELSRQLANLSPKAAAAVQAAAEASTDEERDAALDEVVEDDEDINRGLLLKFLGSVNN